jgi:hypothetical protein
MAGVDSKINNIIGSKLPQWLLYQLETRANQNSKDIRDNDNIIYLGNKSSWVRVISSINIQDEVDLTYFKNTIGANVDLGKDGKIEDPSSLAKQYILYGGTSKYLNNNSYSLRAGLDYDGAYGMLGKNEVQQFGYKPMPGINNVTIETQGRLGSLRVATVNFKCWDKNQLDIIDALYFKLGFTMFIEWGHTFFYPSQQKDLNGIKLDPSKVVSTELFAIDPFEKNLSKEQIFYKIAKNSRDTEGNYDAMLGICTNFTFTYTQDGGYDCTLRIMSLGVLGDSIKINNSGTLPDLLEEEITIYNNTLAKIDKAKRDAEIRAQQIQQTEERNRSASDIANYPDCIKETNLPGSKFIQLNNDLVTNGRNGKKPFYPYAYTAVVNNNGVRSELYFYIDGRYQTTGLSGEGTYKCDNGVLFIDGKSILSTGNNNQTIEEYLKYVYDQSEKLLATQRTRYYWFPSDKNSSGPNFPNANISNKFPILANTDINSNESLGYYISSINGILPHFEKINSGIKVKLNYAKFQNKTGGSYDNDTLDAGIRIYNYKKYQYVSNKRDYFIEIRNYDRLVIGTSTIKVNKPNDSGLKISGKVADTESKSPDETRKIKLAILEFIKDPGSLFNLESVEFSDYFKGGDEESVDIKLSAETIVYLDRDILLSYNKNGTFIKDEKYLQKNIPYKVKFDVLFNDTYIIEGIQSPSNIIQPPGFVPYQTPVTTETTTTTTTQAAAASSEQQNTGQSDDPLQTDQSITSQSSLELILKTIQVHTLNKAIASSGNRLDLGMRPFALKLLTEDQKFLKQIFSIGVMSNFINKLTNGDAIDDTKYITGTEEERFTIHVKYGFATNLMANTTDITNFTPNNFNETLNVYALPYDVDQEVLKGTTLNRPVYIPLGFLLMILNNSCSIYDTKGDFQTPLVYMDFNNRHNFFLSTPTQLSTDAFNVIIPFEGTKEDYTTLFDPQIIDANGLKPVSGSTDSQALFDPSKDALSKSILPVKYDQIENSNAYRGRLMNILLSIDYLVQLVKDYSYKDGSNSVYLKPFLEEILSKINKSLGDFNALRLGYNDQGNCFQIIDDQFIPSPNESQIYTNTRSLEPDNRTELPLIGKKSIAKSLEIKTDVSSRLANMIAISSNSTIQNKATLSTNGDSVGYLNTNFIDRYIKDKLEVTGSGQVTKDYDTLKIAAKHFNQTIIDFYNTGTPSTQNVSDATNYYIEKLTKVKNNDYATRASSLIPVSLNFSTDGISGMGMGNGFTVPQELLPYTYASKRVQGMPKSQIDNVGFIVTGLTHNIENNIWNTSVRANMYYLKDRTNFNYTASKPDSNLSSFTGTPMDNNFVGSESGGSGGVSSGNFGCDRAITYDPKFPPAEAVWNTKKQKWEPEYSCADQVASPDSINTGNFGNGRKYYGEYVFKKGTSDINLSKAKLTALTESEIIDDTTQNRFLMGTITTNPDERVFVVHHTAGGRGPASRTYHTFYSRGLPAQYVIDGDAKIHRFMPDGAKGWHAGNYNYKSIGVEISARNNDDVTQAQVNAAVRLIHYLGFKKSQVVGHGEISKKKQATEGKKVVDLIRTL